MNRRLDTAEKKSQTPECRSIVYSNWKMQRGKKKKTRENITDHYLWENIG